MLNDIKKIQAKRLYVLALLTGLLNSFISIANSIIAGEAIDNILAQPALFLRGVLLVISVYVFQIVISTTNCWYGYAFEIEENRRMRDKAFSAHLHKAHIDQEEIAEFTTLIHENIPSAVSNIFSGTMHIIICCVAVLSCSFALFTMNWIWALIIISASAAMVLVPQFMNSRGKAAVEAYMKSAQKYNLKMQSFLYGHSLIRAFGYFKNANDQMQEANRARTKESRRRWAYSTGVYGISTSLNMLQNAAILVIGIFFILNGRVSLGELVAAMQLAVNICGTMEALSFYIHERNESRPLLEQYETLLKGDGAGQIEASKGRPVGQIGSIGLKNVSYSAGDVAILRNANLTIKRGEKVLVCGQSGSGKSTVLRLLARMQEPTEGEVLINGCPIQSFDTQEYYRNVCMMPQESYLFYTTLRDNILMGRDIPEEEYKNLLRMVNLEYLEERMKNSALDKQQLENLSGGEKQRICLARTMAGKPQIYLLDEITASLDAKNTDEIMRILFQLDATCVFVCHHANDAWQKYWSQIYEVDDKTVNRL